MSNIIDTFLFPLYLYDYTYEILIKIFSLLQIFEVW
jgi:hypothetical protein